MKLKYLIPLATLLFIGACSEEHKDHSTAKPKEHSTKEHESHAHEATEKPMLNLNNGQKWEMDVHTRTALLSMKKIVSEKLEPVGKNLKDELQALINGCTMVGPEHNELHKYLTVLMPAIDDIAAEYSDEKLETVKDILKVYPNFFN